jgi:hypothetical protein
MATLTPRQQNERRLARRLGFKDEFAYRRFIKKHQSFDESDPRYLRKGMKGRNRESEIKRIKRVDKRIGSSAKVILRKANILLYGDTEEISPARFWDSFGNQIQEALASPETSERDKLALRRLAGKIHKQMSVPDWMKPGDQLTLFE